MRAAALALAVLLQGCTYDLVFVKVVGEGCSSVTAGQAVNDSSGDATGTAAGGGGSFLARLERAFASDDRCSENGEDDGAEATSGVDPGGPGSGLPGPSGLPDSGP